MTAVPAVPARRVLQPTGLVRAVGSMVVAVIVLSVTPHITSTRARLLPRQIDQANTSDVNAASTPMLSTNQNTNGRSSAVTCSSSARAGQASRNAPIQNRPAIPRPNTNSEPRVVARGLALDSACVSSSDATSTSTGSLAARFRRESPLMSAARLRRQWAKL